MNFRQIKETCIYVTDLAAAREFYHGILSLPIVAEVPGKHIFFKVGPSMLLCFNPNDSRWKTSPPAHHATGPYHFAFEVAQAEYQQHSEALERKGVKIIDRLRWPNGLESLYFHDPAGNVLEIVPEGVWGE
jgi:catechol 2,3-dioxygenase-like lactoylglutathione lyase family enzyme